MARAGVAPVAKRERNAFALRLTSPAAQIKQSLNKEC